MIRLLTIPGCPRAKSLKQLFKDLEIAVREDNLYQILCDSSRHADLIEQIARTCGCSVHTLLAEPSRISRPLLVVEREEDSSWRDFYSALKERDYYPQCTRKCSKRSVCPAAKMPVDVIYESVSSEIGQNQ